MVTPVTNSTLIADEIAAKIKNVAVARFSIRTVGANAKTLDRLRELPGSFDHALEGIAHLRIQKAVR